MRPWLVLVGVLLTPSRAEEASTNPYGASGICIVNSVEVVNELLDSSVYIWAATKRCGEHGEPTQCEVDVASAVEAITKAITVMVEALTQCGQLSHTGCGVAVGNLVSSLAGIAAASGEITESCPPEPPRKPCDTFIPTEGHPEGVPLLETALCVVDIKNSLRSIFFAARAFMTVKANCKHGGEECAANSLSIIAALASLGGYVAGAVGHCSPIPPHPVPLCAKGILMLTRNIADVSEAGIEIKEECRRRRRRRRRKSSAFQSRVQGYINNMSIPATPALAGTAYTVTAAAPGRLYGEDYNNDDAENNWQKGHISPLNLALVALLPITAFASFAVGWSRHRSSPSYESLREVDVA